MHVGDPKNLDLYQRRCDTMRLSLGDAWRHTVAEMNCVRVPRRHLENIPSSHNNYGQQEQRFALLQYALLTLERKFKSP